VQTIARYIDRMLVIFPFEEDLYRQAGIEATFVGHPLKDVVQKTLSKSSFFRESGFSPEKPLLGLLPGSREQEVRRLLPGMVRAYRSLQDRLPGLQAVLGKARTLTDDFYAPHLCSSGIAPVRGRTHEVMSHSDVVLVASGTATLETTLLGTPMVILYKMAPLSFLIAKQLVHVDRVGLPNIIAGAEIVPELLQGDANSDRMAEEAFDLLMNAPRQRRVIRALKDVSRQLGDAGAAERAAGEIDAILNERS
jgi:lipid-A-disaccharide synthase